MARLELVNPTLADRLDSVTKKLKTNGGAAIPVRNMSSWTT